MANTDGSAQLQRVVIVGASLAGLNAAETLRAEGFEGEIVLIGDEPHDPYDRPPLSKQLLTGEWDAERILLRSPDEIADLRLGVRRGSRAVALDPRNRVVMLDDGEQVSFDGLIIATGADPVSLPGADVLEGVYTLRNQADALRIRSEFEAAAESGGRIVVIGAGFIGAEVASSARARGLDVTLVEALEAPMIGPLGPELAGWAAQLHAEAGVDLRMNKKMERLIGGTRVEAIQLGSGETIPAAAVVIGIGVRPAVGWLEDSGLSIGDGIICDQFCRAAPLIYAAGDVCRWPNGLFSHFSYAQPNRTMRIEHWTNAIEQGMAAARNLLLEARGEPLEPFTPVPYFWSDQHGKSIMASGITSPRDEVVVAHGGLDERRFVALYGVRGHLSGVVAVGWPRMLRRYQAMIREQVSWEEALQSAE